MLDIKLLRENPTLVKESEKKRNHNPRVIEEILKLDQTWKDTKLKVEELKHKRNTVSLEINELKKSNKDISHKVKEMQSVAKHIQELDQKSLELLNKRDSLFLQIGNIIHKSVPLGKDTNDNKIIRKWGKPTKLSFKPKTHVELTENLKIADFDASAKTSGNGFYFLKNELALLNQALIRFTIDFMYKKKYTYIEPPLMLRKNILAAATDFETLKNSIYNLEDEDLSLIGTSEYSLLAMHTNHIFQEKNLPKKYFSYTMCFRREIGAHGINEKGLWRTHQFNKVEQFIFCKPEDSYKYYEELLKNTEEIFKKLKIPYRINESCSGDLALWKSKSADLEAYRPTTNTYEEVASLSNCTDYQARKLNIKLLKGNDKEVVHTLNNTALATSRAMVVILENYQQKDGSIKIPTVLQKYMYNLKKIGGKK